MYCNVNFNVFFKLIKVHLLVSELYIYQMNGATIKKDHTYILKELRPLPERSMLKSLLNP